MRTWGTLKVILETFHTFGRWFVLQRKNYGKNFLLHLLTSFCFIQCMPFKIILLPWKHKLTSTVEYWLRVKAGERFKRLFWSAEFCCFLFACIINTTQRDRYTEVYFDITDTSDKSTSVWTALVFSYTVLHPVYIQSLYRNIHSTDATGYNTPQCGGFNSSCSTLVGGISSSWLTCWGKKDERPSTYDQLLKETIDIYVHEYIKDFFVKLHFMHLVLFH